MSDGEAEAGVSSTDSSLSDTSDYNESNGLLSRAKQVRNARAITSFRALMPCPKSFEYLCTCNSSYF